MKIVNHVISALFQVKDTVANVLKKLKKLIKVNALINVQLELLITLVKLIVEHHVNNHMLFKYLMVLVIVQQNVNLDLK